VPVGCASASNLLEKEHPQTLRSMANLAVTYNEQGGRRPRH